MSRKPGPQSCHPFSSLLPPRTPGTLGLRDAADPNVMAHLGDTPGTLRVNDGAAHVASGKLDVPHPKQFGSQGGGGSSLSSAASWFMRKATGATSDAGMAKTKEHAQYTLIIAINPSATTKFFGTEYVETPVNPGHTIVALKDSNDKLETVFSFGPAESPTPYKCSYRAETDFPLDKRDSYTLFEFSITTDQHKKALDKMKEITANPGAFDGWHQCTTKYLEVAHAAGISVPDGKGDVWVPTCHNVRQVSTPINLDRELLKQFPSAKKVPATYFNGVAQFK